MKDEDYISLLSWCEDWEPEQVYETAYKQSPSRTIFRLGKNGLKI